jgi:hypothetical protein
MQITHPIHQAAAQGDLVRVKELLNGEPHLLNTNDEEGRTPLHPAVEERQLAAIELLLAWGADINARDNTGETPLHKASHNSGWTDRFVSAAKVRSAQDEQELWALDQAGQTHLICVDSL